MEKVTYSEKEMQEVLFCKADRIRELRQAGILKGTKVGKTYVYHIKEIEELFNKYRGKDLPSTNKKRC